MQFKKAFTKVANKFAKRIKQAIADENAEERAAAINELREYVKSLMPDYRWYWEKLVPEAFNCDILDEIKRLKKSMYKQSDVYFRKANFVYRFFQPYLVDEVCVVTKDMVNDLLERCNEIIEAAKEEGLIDHIVFSSHQPGDEVLEILDENMFEGVTMGINILNFPYRWKGVEHAYKNNYGVVAMNPLNGGTIPKHKDDLAFLAKEGEKLCRTFC